MIRLIVGLLAAVLFVTSAAAGGGDASSAPPSQPPPSQPPSSPMSSPKFDVSGSWQGRWISPSGYVYETTLVMRAGADGAVSGSFDWVLKQSPRPGEQAKLGQHGTEHVSGRVDSGARVVDLQGTSKDDPNTVIGLDRYRLVVSDDGRVMGGITWNHGDWRGQITLSRNAVTQ